MFYQVPICIGVFMNSFFDLKFNIVGIVYASAGVFVTALYQVVSVIFAMHMGCSGFSMHSVSAQ